MGAARLENHELVEMRRIAALLSKKNRMFRDAMETARDSGIGDLCEELLRFFVDAGDKECFAACLYTCYDYIRPDVALELSWRHRMMDFGMPYLIQVVREYSSRLDALDKKSQKQEEEKEKEKSAANDYVPEYVMPRLGNPMLMASPAMPQQQPFGGMGGMQGGIPNMGGCGGLGTMGMPQSMGPSF